MKKVSECGKRRGDVAAKAVFAASAVFSVFAVFAIVFYILYESVPALSEIGVFNFIFGTLWAPTKDFLDVSERFGVLPMIVGTLCVSAGAVLVGGVAGVFSAICLKAFCPKKLRGVIGGMINFLAGIPSIVYGFFGLTLLVPMLSDISSTGSGKGILASSLILGMMILPTVTSMTKDALDAVPDSYREGALALGATPQQAMFKVVVPAAKSGIITSLVLGMGRAVGETMAVMMVAGNVPEFPKGLFSNIRTLTINMVVEMGYATGLHRQALIATGSVLLVIVLALNFGIGLARRPKKYREKKGKNVLVSKSERSAPVFVKSGSGCTVLKYISIVCVAVVAASLATLIVFILVKGLPHIDANLLFGESGNAGMTLRPAFVTTGLLILIALAIALPIGICAAIFLAEYSKRDSRLVRVIRLFTETLSGMPSIIFGFFGMLMFCELMQMRTSILAGGITLSLMILPTVIRSTEESLLVVDNSLREASLALGAGKLRTTVRVVLPSALSGIVTAIILSIGRIVGESAALIYTAGAVPYEPESVMDSGSSFAVMMWLFASEGLYIDYAYATAAVLLIMVALINVAVFLVKRRLAVKAFGASGLRGTKKAQKESK